MKKLISKAHFMDVDPLSDEDFFQFSELVSYPIDAGYYFDKITNEQETVTCIIFQTCKLSYIPGVYTTLHQSEYFSSFLDFHSMIYNEQLEDYEVTYIWALFNWIEVRRTYDR